MKTENDQIMGKVHTTEICENPRDKGNSSPRCYDWPSWQLEAKAENVGGLSWENMQNKEAGRLSLFSVKN